jgi:hypothetical protein
MILKNALVAAVGLALASGSLHAADKKKDEAAKWDVNAAHGPTKTIAF